MNYKNDRFKKRVHAVALAASLIGASLFSVAWGSEGAQGAALDEDSDAFKLVTARTWLFRSFLDHEDDDANVLGQEMVSTFGLGNYDVVNISYLELADYPVAIPGQPPGNPEPEVLGAATGINDLLTAFLFSEKGAHHGPHHFGYGFAAQFLTGDDDTLSSGKYSLGPAIEYEY